VPASNYRTFAIKGIFLSINVITIPSVQAAKIHIQHARIVGMYGLKATRIGSVVKRQILSRRKRPKVAPPIVEIVRQIRGLIVYLEKIYLAV
jgi:hypothetical protein